MSLNTNLLLAATGSVAAIRVPLLVKLLQQAGFSVQIITTPAAAHFLELEASLPPDVPVHTDDAEWRVWAAPGDPVLHIDLRNWAHVLLIAPLSANSLAKLATGVCDSLLLCVARAWQFAEKPFFVAPAMNTHMWQHPVTDPQLNTIRQWGVHVIPPVEKRLACGDVGIGAMESPDLIVHHVVRSFHHLPSAKHSH